MSSVGRHQCQCDDEHQYIKWLYTRTRTRTRIRTRTLTSYSRTSTSYRFFPWPTPTPTPTFRLLRLSPYWISQSKINTIWKVIRENKLNDFIFTKWLGLALLGLAVQAPIILAPLAQTLVHARLAYAELYPRTPAQRPTIGYPAVTTSFWKLLDLRKLRGIVRGVWAKDLK